MQNFALPYAPPPSPCPHCGTAALQMTFAHMCITGLDVLGKLETCSEAEKMAVKGWVLAQQVTGIYQKRVSVLFDT